MQKVDDRTCIVETYHLLWRVAARTLMKHALLSFASALASIVFPVPGGP